MLSKPSRSIGISQVNRIPPFAPSTHPPILKPPTKEATGKIITPHWEQTYSILKTRLNLEDDFLFPRWDTLVAWRVHHFFIFFEASGPLPRGKHHGPQAYGTGLKNEWLGVVMGMTSCPMCISYCICSLMFLMFMFIRTHSLRIEIAKLWEPLQNSHFL